jgi:hypothetical protein
MHPSSLCSYYPNYALLDEILSYGKYDNVYIYIDLKNCFQTLYQEHAILNIIENSTNSKYQDMSILLSYLSFLSFHKMYAIKRNININYVTFFESGKSYYHQNISKLYKKSRQIDDLYGLPIEKREVFFQNLSDNYNMVQRVGNKLPNSYVVRLLNLEADFVPYYLISRKLVETNENTCHIVYSNDHDLMQTLTAGDNVYIFQKTVGKKYIVKKNNVMKKEWKIEEPFELTDKFLPLSLAIIGDTGDDVYGIKGIGSKTLYKNQSEVMKMIGSIENLFNNVEKGLPIFDTTSIENPNKYIQMILDHENKDKLISNNLKLVSFELISRFFENPPTTETLEKRKQVEQIFNNKIIIDQTKLTEALQMGNVYASEELDTLYFTK